MNTNALFLVSALLVVLVDSIYLNAIKNFFGAQIRDVQKSPMKLNMTATLVAYVFIIFGLNYFIIRKRASVSDAFLLGFAIYGIYEFTNMALFKDWRWSTAVIDTTWGGILFALVTYITYFIDKL